MSQLFKAFIRVVKSIAFAEYSHFSSFDTCTIIREPVIEAKDKNEVKKIMLEKYPQFFQNGKVYERETKDTAQFFYLTIFPLDKWEIELINQGSWTCASCGQVHENRYVSKPLKMERTFGSDVLFCKSDDEYCLNEYTKKKFNSSTGLADNVFYVRADSPNYIYKITEKATGKSYIGKTKNEPFFRWWDHLKKNESPFGLYLRQSKLSDWTFEVLDMLPCGMSDADVFMVETEYIMKFDSINNGFNSMVSNKDAASSQKTNNQPTLFES